MSLRRFTRAIPFNYEDRGIYSIGATTGIMAAGLAAGSEIFQFRWAPADTDLIAAIQKIWIDASVSTTFFAAGVPCRFDLAPATSWTAAGTGGSGITPSTGLKLDTEMADTAVAAGDIRIASTAALGAGTKTLGLNIGNLSAGGPITASLNGTILPPQSPLFEADVASGEHPLVLRDEQGFAIRATVPGTGTWSATVHVLWAETTSYPFGRLRST